MLCLARREQQRILIGDNIEIVILKLGPKNVRVGIQAPPDVEIVRGELTNEKVGGNESTNA